jgi:probable DNA metabolism protein
MKRIPIEPSFAVWRRAARALLRQGVEPSQIDWVESECEAEGEASVSGDAVALAAPAIPRELLFRLKTAACFRAPDRWALLYRILWRWTHGERHVLALNDPDGALLDQRIQAVEHETDDLVILTLFRRRDPSMGLPEFVGWYEPRHDLLERAAARFAERMGDSTWMLATPHGAAFWNGMLLRIGRPAAEEHEQAAHALPESAMTGEAITSTPTEALWLAYYASAFNGEPSPVPLRYWRMPPAGPPLPARLARERSRLGAQSAPVTVPLARSPPAGAARYGATRNRRLRVPGPPMRRSWWSANSPARTRTSKASPSSARPVDCWTPC